MRERTLGSVGSKASYRLLPRVLGLAVILMFAVEAADPSAAAPLTEQWSIPQTIPGYDDGSPAPYLVADNNRTVHAFTNKKVEQDQAIVYSQWSLKQGWTAPVDILLSPVAQQARIVGALLDQAGEMHVAFFGGNELGAGIFYSHAPASTAVQAPAWSPVAEVADDAATPTSAAMAGDGHGNLFILYSGKRDGFGLYWVHSADSGTTWSLPQLVFPTSSDNLWPFAIQMVLDRQGRLHLVWAVHNVAGIGEAIYYARLESDHTQWSTPITLALRDKNGYEVAWPSIVVNDSQILVIYDNDVSSGSIQPTRWMRQSTDGGQTWTTPIRPFPHVGSYGHAVFSVDSSSVLHVVLGNRIGNPEIHGMWHSVWRADHWDILEPIVSGPRTPKFDPSLPQLVISQGRVLLATWQNDPGREMVPTGVWYSYTMLDAPELPVKVLPAPAARPTSTAAPTLPAPTVMVTRAEVIRQVGDSQIALNGNETSIALLVAVVPVSLLISAVIIVHLAGRH